MILVLRVGQGRPCVFWFWMNKKQNVFLFPGGRSRRWSKLTWQRRCNASTFCRITWAFDMCSMVIESRRKVVAGQIRKESHQRCRWKSTSRSKFDAKMWFFSTWHEIINQKNFLRLRSVWMFWFSMARQPITWIRVVRNHHRSHRKIRITRRRRQHTTHWCRNHQPAARIRSPSICIRPVYVNHKTIFTINRRLVNQCPNHMDCLTTGST